MAGADRMRMCFCRGFAWVSCRLCRTRGEGSLCYTDLRVNGGANSSGVIVCRSRIGSREERIEGISSGEHDKAARGDQVTMVESRRAPLSPCGTSSYEFAPWHTSSQSRELVILYIIVPFYFLIFRRDSPWRTCYSGLASGINQDQANVKGALAC